jgi:hypothetical protein
VEEVADGGEASEEECDAAAMVEYGNDDGGDDCDDNESKELESDLDEIRLDRVNRRRLEGKMADD